ncbi:hypothetical protein H4582DRAFT_2128654 [Lactarius indigo]|nr:hypothetical protein H4582DRAFT_2128654 [Lactarius indigo]
MSETIKSGQRYKITNEENGLVPDLSGADHKSILRWDFHSLCSSGSQRVRPLRTTANASGLFDQSGTGSTLDLGICQRMEHRSSASTSLSSGTPRFYESEDHDNPRLLYTAQELSESRFPKDDTDHTQDKVYLSITAAHVCQSSVTVTGERNGDSEAVKSYCILTVLPYYQPDV